MIIPMLCVTIFVMLGVWFLLTRVARLMIHTPTAISIFFFIGTAHTKIYTLSLHDALPIYSRRSTGGGCSRADAGVAYILGLRDRKSTRLNSSHSQISYAVFCLKKKTLSRWLTTD